jgi:chromosome segregation ATPase
VAKSTAPSALRRIKDCCVLIEQAMYFALGFLVAGLFALMFLPAFWRRAMRLSMRRLQMFAPMSMDEVVAERDLLRAEFAVRERRLEQAMEATQAARADDLATIGRHLARIVDLEAQLERAEADMREMNARLGEAQKVLAERTELLSSTELALHEMTDRAESRVARLRLVGSESAPLDETEAQPEGLVAYESRVAALHQHNGEMQRALEALQEEHARAAQSAARATELEDQVARLSGELAATRAQGETLSAELNETRAELKAAQDLQTSGSDQLEGALRVARAAANDAAGKLESVRADNAMLQGAVEALRAERANLRRAVNGAKGLSVVPVAASDAEIASLREAIVDFGDRVIAQERQAPAKRA